MIITFWSESSNRWRLYTALFMITLIKMIKSKNDWYIVINNGSKIANLFSRETNVFYRVGFIIHWYKISINIFLKISQTFYIISFYFYNDVFFNALNHGVTQCIILASEMRLHRFKLNFHKLIFKWFIL